uniref:(northern house mosquito) hypothetical protein n=1 Tax=Culex pipiens TaxID=7175 RepID=A0A8D8A3R0_CULPI
MHTQNIQRHAICVQTRQHKHAILTQPFPAAICHAPRTSTRKQDRIEQYRPLHESTNHPLHHSPNLEMFRSRRCRCVQANSIQPGRRASSTTPACTRTRPTRSCRTSRARSRRSSS